ncbi:MAG TPA: MBL fold metallo-hydrolase [Syntrophales bacterium]|nr:MBL fold metallo-hydrolase [Syntrophales bacterium]
MKIARDLHAYERTSYSENNCNRFYIGGEVGALINPGPASFVPGHSPGSIALYDPGCRAFFCGDVFFHRNVGRTDFPGGDARLLKENILALAEPDVEILLPGHMGILEGKGDVEENFRIVVEDVFPYLR